MKGQKNHATNFPDQLTVFIDYMKCIIPPTHLQDSSFNDYNSQRNSVPVSYPNDDVFISPQANLFSHSS